MQLVEVTAPDIFPRFVSVAAARLIDDRPAEYFAAGRACARRALRERGAVDDLEIPRGPSGEPLWPDGFTGSITHTRGFVAAAIAKRSEARSIGLDAEQVIDDERANRIAPAVLVAHERQLGSGDVSDGLRVSLVFSMKEALFKCLYPVVQRRFFYEAACVRSIDFGDGRFIIELLTPLTAAMQPGATFEGRCAVREAIVFAGVVFQ